MTDDRFRMTRIPLTDLTENHLTQIYDRAERTETAEHERALDNIVLRSIAKERDAAEEVVEGVRGALAFAERVVATSGPGPAGAVQAVADRLRAALDDTALPLAVGDVLHGFCGGAFGRDHYECSRVEALGSDWVVVRGDDTGIGFASGQPQRLTEYRAENDYCPSHPCPVQPREQRP